MGLERLLCGALERYSRQLRLGSVHTKARLFRKSLMSSETSPNSSVLPRLDASRLYSGIFLHTGGQMTTRRGLCTSTQPSRDVTLFEHDRTHFFRLLSVFCGGQFMFWTYLAHFAFTGLRETGAAKDKAKAKAPTTTTGLAGLWSFEMNLGSNTWRYGFTLGCLTIGVGIVGLGALFCRRSVSKVVLHKGGRMVTVCTQSPLGTSQGRILTVPLSQVACHAHRQESPSFIPLRVKGHKFYFLLDKEGAVNNARLFDITVGAYRPV
ncbi:transmembrane protein 223 [Odontesthes bonariensis]|uniref:transmembrane protein 223 n=1 Tax=Odontesthes bonariensis TaxID=219752 RepID=UPI003F580FE8